MNNSKSIFKIDLTPHHDYIRNVASRMKFVAKQVGDREKRADLLRKQVFERCRSHKCSGYRSMTGAGMLLTDRAEVLSSGKV